MTLSGKAKALFDGKELAKLGLVSEDGAAQARAVWITRDGDTPVFTTVHGRAKTRSMQRNSRVTHTIVDPDDGDSAVGLRGHNESEQGQAANGAVDLLVQKDIDHDTYPCRQPGDVRLNCRVVVEREFGM